MSNHPFTPDEYGDCADCPLPEAHPRHATEAPDLAPVASLGIRHTPTQGGTSEAAALSAWPRAGSTRARVLEAITRAGEYGVTDDELAARLDGMSANTIRPRRGELVTAGWVRAATRDDGRPLTRASSQGNAATVWTLTAAARARTARNVA